MNRYFLPVLCFVFLFAGCARVATTAEPAPVVAVEEERGRETAVATDSVEEVLPAHTPASSATPPHTPSPTITPTETATMTPTPTIAPSPIPLPTASIWTTDLAPGSESFQIVDQMGGQINAVTAQNGIAYVGVGPRLWTIDVSQPEEPITLGQSDILPGLVQRVAVVNDTAYLLTEDESGFWIVDVSRPYQPQIVDFFEMAVPINFLQGWNGRLYIGPSSREEDALIFSSDDPFHPTLLGELPRNYYPRSNDDFVVISTTNDNNQTTILMTDATDLNNPSLISEVTANMNGYFMEFDRERYYLLDMDGMPSIWVMGAEDPANTLKKLNIELSPYFRGIHIQDQIIYVQENFADGGEYGSSIKAFDVSQNHARPLERLSAGNKSYGLFVDEGIAYIAAGEKLLIAGINEERNLEKLSEWRSLGDLVWIDANRNQIFTLNSWDNRIYQWDVNSTQDLQLLHDHQSGRIDVAALGESGVFTAGWFTGIHRYNSTIIPWQETAVFDLPSRIETVAQMIIQDETLYARLDRDLTIFDISEPAQLTPIGQLEWETYHIGPFAVDQDKLFAWVDYGLKVISLADPNVPQEIGMLPDESEPYLYDLAVNDNFVYLLTTSCREATCDGKETRLQVVDATDPANMTIAAQLPILNGITNLELSGDNLILSGIEFWLVDVSNPAQPQINGQIETPGYASDAVIINDLIYVADGAGGLLILRMGESSQPSQ